ncbi:TetR/AcrR family transcriptional regulator [Asanoa sp. NPDC049518]|uniref:TetR/AcrR family transcriptional regulator n=1 Tax=unclassified Asanoa TaxID=2685164 RepID=UPI00341FD6AD
MATSSGQVRTTAPRGRRADARRNIEAILDTAVACLARDPEASVVDIAAAAGVGRVTLYSHFKTRAELIDAALVRTIQHADHILAATDTSGEPVRALINLVSSTWQIVHQFRNVLLAAQRELPSERIRGVHNRVLRRTQSIIERGRRSGAFRTDLPKHWLITTAFSLMHAAAEDASSGRIKVEQAPALITATLLAAFTAPGATVHDPPGPPPQLPQDLDDGSPAGASRRASG